jgi:hypothetical protein
VFAARRCSHQLRITIYATLIVILATGAACAQYDPWRTPKQKENDQDIDRAYQSTIERPPASKGLGALGDAVFYAHKPHTRRMD